MANSSVSANGSKPAKTVVQKPKKPFKDFPLSPHPSGAWQKKIHGKIHYFGRWGRSRKGVMQILPNDGEWAEALKLFNAQKESLFAGLPVRSRSPNKRKKADCLVKNLCNEFRTAKQRSMKDTEGGITRRTYEEYVSTCDLVIEHLGKDRLVSDLEPSDFATLKTVIDAKWGLVRRGNTVGRVKTLFKWGRENAYCEEVVFGSEFKKTPKGILRKHRANNGKQNGKKSLTPEECRTLLGAAPVPLKAMILLGLNGGLGNHDVASLPEWAVDLEAGWIDFPRPKTGIARRFPLWPITITALQDALDERVEPKENAVGLFFTTVRGNQWLANGKAEPVTNACLALMKSTGVHRSGIGFYSLRHTFRTAALGARDRTATRYIMGHAADEMDENYTGGEMPDSQLQAVTDHVHSRLFDVNAAGKQIGGAE